MDGDAINDVSERLYSLNKLMERLIAQGDLQTKAVERVADALEAIGAVIETRQF